MCLIADRCAWAECVGKILLSGDVEAELFGRLSAVQFEKKTAPGLDGGGFDGRFWLGLAIVGLVKGVEPGVDSAADYKFRLWCMVPP